MGVVAGGLRGVVDRSVSVGGAVRCRVVRQRRDAEGPALKNTVRPNVSQEEAETVKAKFKAATQGGDLFVTGREWEYKPIQAEAVGAEWLAAQETYGISDVAGSSVCRPS